MTTVYSKAPISIEFEILEKDELKKYVIKGVNCLPIIEGFNEVRPNTTEMTEATFNAIKEKYKDHVRLFGGRNHDGVMMEAQIWIESKNLEDAKKKMKDSKPVYPDSAVITKSKTTEKYIAEND